MRRVYGIIVLAGILSVLNVSVHAQYGDTLMIDEVVISGSRVEIAKNLVPATISLLGAEQIESFEEPNILPAVASMVPGLFVSEVASVGYGLGRGTSGQLTIRGVGGTPNAQVLMLVDGQPQYMGIFGHPLPNFHMTSNVERVEVIRGPASLLYGSNAMGGVINMITRDVDSEGIGFTGYGAYGMFNTVKGGGTVHYKKDKFAAGLSLNHLSTDGHRDTSAYVTNSLHGYTSYELNRNWEAKAGYTFSETSFEDPGSLYDPQSGAFSGDIMRQMATFSLRNSYQHLSGGVYAFLNLGDHQFSDGWRSSDRNMGVNLFQRMDIWDGGSVTLGSDVKNYGGIGSLGFFSDTLLTIWESAGYMVGEQQLGEILRLSAGLRYDLHSKYGGSWIPQAGITFLPSAGTIIKGNYSRGFRAPTLMELYLFAPNPNLTPEKVHNYELSLVQRIAGSIRAEITSYLLRGEDLILLIPNPDPGPPMTRINGGTFSHWGVEAELNAQPVKSLKLDATYSYLNTGDPRYFSPRHKAYLGLRYTIGDYTLGLHTKYIGGLYTFIDDQVREKDIQQDYLILNMRIGYRLNSSIELYMAGKNLFNSEYETVYGYPMPGIHVIGGAKFSLGS